MNSYDHSCHGASRRFMPLALSITSQVNTMIVMWQLKSGWFEHRN